MDIPNSEKCRLVLKVLEYVETRPDGAERLSLFLQDERFLVGVDEIKRLSGWSESWVRKLCQANKLPHIPGKEIKFVYSDVFDALRKMQVGGDFGKRKRRRKD